LYRKIANLRPQITHEVAHLDIVEERVIEQDRVLRYDPEVSAKRVELSRQETVRKRLALEQNYCVCVCVCVYVCRFVCTYVCLS